MPVIKSSREEAVEAIMREFRNSGYDAASLARLSAATGLGKSSLYHYFPNGKEDMAKAAVARTVELVAEAVIEPLTGVGSLKARVQKAMTGLARFYNGGKASCLVDLFTVGEAEAATPGLAKAMAEALLRAFAGAAEEAGHPKRQAKDIAERAVVEIEGALVLARALGSTRPFQRMLARLPALLLGGKA
ncbi:MAG: TetR/AcrR family transcriptional regulator [Alphaproteobacteria bacterium]|nr:TetR/AcrR family transcriptional regulator [Alphaproteobacteria bacterium]